MESTKTKLEPLLGIGNTSLIGEEIIFISGDRDGDTAEIVAFDIPGFMFIFVMTSGGNKGQVLHVGNSSSFRMSKFL